MLLFWVAAWTFLCGRCLCTHRYACGDLHQLSLSFPGGHPAPVLWLKDAPESTGLPPALLHVIFICLIKANLIKAGMAEMRKSSSERRSRPDPKRGPLSSHPQAVASWQQVTQRRQDQGGGSSGTSRTDSAGLTICKQTRKKPKEETKKKRERENPENHRKKAL